MPSTVNRDRASESGAGVQSSASVTLRRTISRLYFAARWHALNAVLVGAETMQDVTARIEARARRAIPGARPHRIVTCGACGVDLYDNHTGEVCTGARHCQRCGTSSFRATCDRCADELHIKEQTDAIVGARRDFLRGSS